MAFEKVVAINLNEADNPEAMEVINILAEEFHRSGRNMAEYLIISAGKQQIEEIKKRKAKEAKK